MLQSANIFLACAAAATPIVKKAPGWVASGSALGVQVVLAIWAAWMLVTHLTTAFQ